MNLVSSLPEYTKPKNVGLMFFSFEPDKFFPYTQIDMNYSKSKVTNENMPPPKADHTRSNIEMERILIIEDEKDVNQLLARNLQNSGYETVSVRDGLDGIEQLRKQQFDMVLLDLMLPWKSGDEVLKEIRKDCDIPVIVISAKDLVGTKIDLLTLGADDYITKPFDLGEVTARVVSNLRRYHMMSREKQLTYKELTLDTESKSLAVNGAVLELTAKEYGIMELLLQSPNKVFSKASLYETIWGYEYLGDENVIKTHISNLRAKMKHHSETEYIETVWGLGYRLAKKD